MANRIVDMRPLWLRAQWSTAFVNDLPDSSFLYIAPGGTKTNGKTTGAHRFFPVKDASGAVDVAHLNNALARIPQASTLSPDVRAQLMTKAKAMAAAHPTIGSGKTAEYEGTAGSGRSRQLSPGFVELPPELPSEALGPQTRTFSLIMEMRASGDGRTLFGRAVPYGVTAMVNAGGKAFQERFMPGVFARQVGQAAVGHIKLYDSHADRMSGRSTAVIGKTTALAERPDGCYGEWSLYDTNKAEDALKLVRAGEVTGLSVGFEPARGGGSRKADDGAIERVSAHLDHVALTSEPVYASAQVLGVRDRLPRYDTERERFRLLVR